VPKVPGIRNPRSDNTAPSIPGDLVATALSATSIGLTWSASTDNAGGVGVAGYQVWKDGSPLATTTALSYTAIGLTAATAYEFNVSAYDEQGNMSPLSETATATTSGSTNVAPVWQTIAQQELTTGTSYSLPLGSFVTDADTPAQPITVTQISGTLPTGITYNSSTKIVSGTPTAASTPTVVFRASDGIATADVSVVFNCLVPDTTAPSVPTNLAGTGVSRQRIDLTWTASTDAAGASQRSSGLAGYKLYRDGLLRATLGPSTLSYSDTGLSANTTYSYRISAYDAATPANESAQCTAVPVATSANSEPEWVTPADLGTFDYPLTADVTMRLLATDDDGDPITYSYDSPLPTGFTITELTDPLGALLTIAAGTDETPFSFTAHANDSAVTAAELDWLSRTQTGPYASGVVWAHNFEHENEVLNFLMAPNTGNDPTQDWAATHHALDTWYEAGTGFAGGGCLVVQTPAADVAFDRSFGQDNPEVYSTGGWYGGLRDAFGVDKPGIPFGRGFWRRPYSPLNGNGDRRRGNGTGFEDINNAGLTQRDWRPWKTEAASEQLARRQALDFKNGLFGNQDYTPPSGWTREGNEFWVQYRMKMPFKRFYSTRMIPAYTGAPGSRWFTNSSPYRARQNASKYLWVANLTDTQRPQEIVVSGNAQLSIADGAPYEYTNPTNFLIQYTGAADPQVRSGTPPESWIVPSTAQEDVWVTYLHRVIWGHNNTPDTVWEWYASVNGSPYVTLASRSNIQMAFDDQGGPWGGNCFEPTHYNNYTDNSATHGTANMRNPAYAVAAGLPGCCGETYQNRFTQIIFSTQFIPAPTV
jgi:chitodextrinase